MQLSLSAAQAQPLVEQIVAGVRTQIDDRVLRVGARLPAIRALADQHGVSRFTVVEAYDRLVALGYLQSRRGAGFFVAPRQEVLPPALPAAQRQRASGVAWLMRRAVAEDPAQLKASVGWLPPGWLDGEGVQRALRQLSRGDTTELRLGCYGDPNGYLPLRQQLCVMLGAKGIEARAEQIVLTLGATQALDLIARMMIRPGDTVLVDDPGYFNLFGALRLLGAKLIGVPRLDDGPDTTALQALIVQHRPRLFITQSILHNPTGSNLSQATAFRVLRLAEQHDMLIVEDDTYGDLAPGHATRLAALDQLKRVIYVGSFAKTLSPNVRVGYLACTPDLAYELTDIKLLTAVSTSELGERVIHRLLTEGHHRKHLDRLHVRLSEAHASCARMLAAAGLRFRQPASGLFIWAALPDTEDASSVAELAEEHGILLAPGKIFRPQLQPSPYLRINVAYAKDVRLAQFFASDALKKRLSLASYS